MARLSNALEVSAGVRDLWTAGFLSSLKLFHIRRNAAYGCEKGASIPTGVGVVFQLRFSIDREGVLMKRLCWYGVTLGLALGCCAVGAQAQFKNGGQAVELRLPPLSQRAVATQGIGL